MDGEPLLGTDGRAATFKRINVQQIKSLVVTLPTPPEQSLIAKTLVDSQKLVSALERLIDKKMAIRQGAMQRLLTGKTRLAGFSEPWVRGSLKQFIPLQRGFDLPTSRVERGDHPVVYSNGVGRYHSKAMVKGPGVVTGRSGTIGKVHFVSEDYWPHNTALWVTSFSRTDARFVFYFLTHLGLERFSSGSGVPTLNRNDAHSFEISVPGNVQEQRAIASVLGEIDSELNALRSHLAKAKAVKQGMMQELLTGRTRLPVKEAVS